MPLATFFGTHRIFCVTAINSLSRLLAAQAVFDIENGNIAKGLDGFQEDMAFYRRILAATDATLLDKMVAVRQIQSRAILLGLLLAEGRLSSQCARVRSLLAPLDSPQKIFRDAMWVEGAAGTQYLFRLPVKFDPEMSMDFDLDGHPVELSSYPEKLLNHARYYFLYKPNMTANLRMELLEHDSPRKKSGGRRMNARDARIYIEHMVCRSARNRIGEVLVLMARPDYADYLLRIHDADAHLRLARARLEYALAAKKPGDDPADIFARLPPETFSPYTERPFDWDAERSTLVFQPADPRHRDERVEIRLSRP